MLPKIPTDDTHNKVDVTEGENNTATVDNSKSMTEDQLGKDDLSNTDNLVGADNSAFEPTSITAKVTEL